MEIGRVPSRSAVFIASTRTTSGRWEMDGRLERRWQAKWAIELEVLGALRGELDRL